MGVWIEMLRCAGSTTCFQVAPFMGVWIEIDLSSAESAAAASRTLHGCVD